MKNSHHLTVWRGTSQNSLKKGLKPSGMLFLLLKDISKTELQKVLWDLTDFNKIQIPKRKRCNIEHITKS